MGLRREGTTVEPDWDTLLMEAYDRWCENEYDTEDEGDDE